MARVRILVLGGVSVRLEGRPASAFESERARALLAFLAVEAGRPHRRERLAGLLWPERPDAVALRNLRQSLFNVRQVLADDSAEKPLISATRDTISFNPDGNVWLDAAAFAGLATTQPCEAGAAERLEEAVGLYRGPFLDGLGRVDSEPFEEWVQAQTERFHRLAVEALSRLTELHAGLGQFEPALKAVWRILELDPWREEAHQQAMRLLAASGQRAAALAQYETCRRVLADELGAIPGPETQALYQRILDGDGLPLRGRPPAPAFVAEPAAPEVVEPPLFVAREAELAQLDAWLDATLRRQGRVGFITGGPGSGKTMLMRHFARQAMQRHADLLVAWGAGNAYIGAGTPFAPFLDILQMLTGDVEARWAGRAITREHALRLWQALPAAAPALLDAGPDLLGRFVDGEGLLRRAQAAEPAETEWLGRLQSAATHVLRAPTDIAPANLSEQMARFLETLARQQPLLLILDDLQWLDQESINLLFHLGRQIGGCRILLLGAYRPADVALGRGGQRHPLGPAIQELGSAFDHSEVNLSQADGRAFIAALLDREPNRLGAAFRETLYRRTEGHALFTVELLRGLRERGGLARDIGGLWAAAPALDWDALPRRLEAVISERLSLVEAPGHDILEAACVQGEEFIAEVVAAVLRTDAGEVIHQLSSELGRRQRLVVAHSMELRERQRLSYYRFRHYLYQHYLYKRLDAAERAHLHEATGRALETLYGEWVGEEAVSLARHFEEAGDAEKAAGYLLHAGRRARLLAAYIEAVAHLEHGLALLSHMTAGPARLRLEFHLQAELGPALQMARGYGSPEAETALTRARELSAALGDPPELFRVLCGLALVQRNRGNYDLVSRQMESLLEQAQRAGDAERVMVCHAALTMSRFMAGDLEAAARHGEQVLAVYDPELTNDYAARYGVDDGANTVQMMVRITWFLGYPERALAHERAAQRIIGVAATVSDDPLLHAFAVRRHPETGWLLGEWDEVLAANERLLAVARELQNSYKEGVAVVIRGWTLAHLGRAEDGVVEIQRGLALLDTCGWPVLERRDYLWMLAEAYQALGRRAEGLQALAAAWNAPGTKDIEADIQRTRGELLLLEPADEVAAEASFRQSIAIAQQQHARYTELQTTISLARLLRRRGRADEGRALLAECYAWFTEGFDTPALRAARALLEEMGE